MFASRAHRSSPCPADAGGQDAHRRKIYLHRLLGDEDSSSKGKTGKKVGWVQALWFASYVLVASFVIIRRSSVAWRSEVWLGSITGIYEQPFSLSPTFKYFDDIRSTEDVVDWLTWFVWFIAESPGPQPLSLVTFNRVMPAVSDEAVIYMTYRRAKLSDSSADPATTSRFQSLYPSTWLASGVAHGASTGDFEDTDLLVFGNFTWRYEPEVGFNKKGGYFAKIVLPLSDNPITDGYVQLNDQQMGLLDFRDATWFGPTFGSMVLQFGVYNPNYQSLSSVNVIFNARQTGLLADKIVDSRSMLLDIHDTVTDICDIVYLIFTCLSFFSLVIKAWQSYGDRAFFMDIWTYIDLLSVIFSLGAFISWRVHVNSMEAFLESATAYKSFDETRSVIEYFALVYCRVSAVATLLIYWRSLPLLSGFNFRLRRLGRSFALMSGKLVAYGSYMFVMFLGFFAFATALFGGTHYEFHTEGIALQTAMAMFFGDIASVTHIAGTLFLLFTVCFMIVFYIFSVQMFNAIINYSYNRVSDDMQAAFDKERRQAATEKARKAALKQGKRSLVTRVKRRFCRLLCPCRPAAFGREQAAAAFGAENAPKRKAQKKSKPAALEQLDEEMREKVKTWLNKADHQESTFKIGTVFMFAVYAMTYFWLLLWNNPVEVKYEVNAALEGTIKPVTIATPQRNGESVDSRWDQLYRNDQAWTWLTEALPEVLFNDPPVNGPPWCIANWNCVIYLQGAGNASTSKEMVLLTVVRRASLTNDGCLDSPCTDGDLPFIGGEELVPVRQYPRDDGDGRETCTDSFDATDLPCSTSCTDGELEIKCSLDAEHSEYMSTMHELSHRGMFRFNTRLMKAEFVVFNGNYNFVSLVALKFNLRTSGRMEKSIDMHTMALFDVQGSPGEIAEILAKRVLPCVLCVCFTLYFSYSLLNELKQAILRRSTDDLDDGYESRLSITLDFIFGDPFNAFELISILTSILNALNFAMWLWMDMNLKDAMDGSLEDLLAYLGDMRFWQSFFVDVSGVSILLLCIRPLKFLKEGNLRIAQLWKTLLDARFDILWFVVMMTVIITGFIMFAWMSFGERFQPCSKFGTTLVHCVEYLFGRFAFGPLYKADPVMASLFFYPYLLVCYIIFSNTLFAIIDRYFVAIDPPTISLKRKLKPFFGKHIRFIEWDNDHTMIQDPQVAKEEGPPTRAKRVHDFAERISTIRETGDVNAQGPAPSTKKARGLPDACDTDERMNEVLSWSRDEARKTINDWHRIALEKYSFKNEAKYIEAVMKGKEGSLEGFEAEESRARSEMEDAFRHMRYSREVHETMAERDQRTLARYITALEHTITEEMAQESALDSEVAYLRVESGKMGSVREEPPDPAGGALSSLEAAPLQRPEDVPDGSVQDGGESDDSYDNW